MGTCASTHHQLYASNKGSVASFQSNVNIVHLDGRLQQLKNPVKAWHILSQNPNCFLCSSEAMRIGSPIVAVSPNEELHLDQIYFLMPMSKSGVPLSLQELGALAIKANATLAYHQQSKAITNNLEMKQSSFSRRNDQRTQPIVSSSDIGCSH